MTQIVNINFANGLIGPLAQTQGGFTQTNITPGSAGGMAIQPQYGRLGGGYGIQIMSDSRGFSTADNRTYIEGYDDSPLWAIGNPDGNFTDNVLTSHPARIQDGDAWWYSFSIKNAQSPWVKGQDYEPIVWQMYPVTPGDYGTVSTYQFPAPVSLSVDWAGHTVGTGVFQVFFYLNTLLPGTVGSDATFFNSSSNFQHVNLGHIASVGQWLDVKMYVEWSAYGYGKINIWTKTDADLSFDPIPTYSGTALQTVAQVGSAPAEGYMRVGYNASLGNSTALNYMQNILYFDNFLAGNSEADVDLFPLGLDIPGSVLFNGGWDTSTSTGSLADNTELLSSDWAGYFAAPNGIPTTKDNYYASYSAAVVNDNTRNSPFAARFEVHPGDRDGFFLEKAEVYGTAIPATDLTADFSWSTYLDDSVGVVNSPIMFWGMLSSGYPQDPPPFGMYANGGSVYLQVNQYSSETSAPVGTIIWGDDINNYLNTWTDFKIVSSLGSSGTASLAVNNNWVATYAGPTVRPQTGGGFKPLYPAMGIRRNPDQASAIVWHDNLLITDGT